MCLHIPDYSRRAAFLPTQSFRHPSRAGHLFSY
jgi:hypothetical protein